MSSTKATRVSLETPSRHHLHQRIFSYHRQSNQQRPYCSPGAKVLKRPKKAKAAPDDAGRAPPARSSRRSKPSSPPTRPSTRRSKAGQSIPGSGFPTNGTEPQHGTTGAPHPDISANPGCSVSLHQAGTAQQPSVPHPKRGRLSHPGCATAWSPPPGRAPEPRAAQISLGGAVVRSDCRRSPPGSTHHSPRSGFSRPPT
ncbi:hypothetical protein NDU88_007965 [Pleurodeles waltl]|uniref:Uncharacterized protein n=1 Tax=Pleurodeles waltl TaxID=8319 RepID=A0AAV7QQB5_PLEWA|nr:hypothetical protein NDU88_007965 [Pleurodeles waltl]